MQSTSCKKNGTTISYPRSTDQSKYELSILSFADVSKGDIHGQLGTLNGFLVRNLANYSILHCASWLSHKSKRSVKSVLAAEILMRLKPLMNLKP